MNKDEVISQLFDLVDEYEGFLQTFEDVETKERLEKVSNLRDELLHTIDLLGGKSE